MPRSDLAAQRSVILIQNLHHSGAYVSNIQNGIGFFHKFKVLRIQPTLFQHEPLVSVQCRMFSMTTQSDAPFWVGIPPDHGCIRRDRSCAVFPAVFRRDTHSGSARHGGVYRNRTDDNCLEGSCVTATPILRITAGGHKPAGCLSSCHALLTSALPPFSPDGGVGLFPAVKPNIRQEVSVPARVAGGERDRIRTCFRRICSAPLIRMSFPFVCAAPLCYHRGGY